ncbi:MAG: hypothetical protein WC505_05225 [Patescibacteria group bacterium]
MRLSGLQKYILLNVLGSRGVFTRKQLSQYYGKLKEKPTPEDQQGIITRSLERLIDKGLLIGYGRRTPQKWFIDEVRLTSAGKRTARKLIGEQQSLPFRRRKAVKNKQ